MGWMPYPIFREQRLIKFCPKTAVVAATAVQCTTPLRTYVQVLLTLVNREERLQSEYYNIILVKYIKIVYTRPRSFDWDCIQLRKPRARLLSTAPGGTLRLYAAGAILFERLFWACFGYPWLTGAGTLGLGPEPTGRLNALLGGIRLDQHY